MEQYNYLKKDMHDWPLKLQCHLWASKAVYHKERQPEGTKGKFCMVHDLSKERQSEATLSSFWKINWKIRRAFIILQLLETAVHICTTSQGKGRHKCIKNSHKTVRCLCVAPFNPLVCGILGKIQRQTMALWFIIS